MHPQVCSAADQAPPYQHLKQREEKIGALPEHPQGARPLGRAAHEEQLPLWSEAVLSQVRATT